ncbi:MAG: peptidoglycan-binding domain-containing protein [Bacillota bacterium]
MHPLIIQRVATVAAMPLVAAGGWAGYSHYGTPYPAPQPQQIVCTTLSTDLYYGGHANDVMYLQRFLSAQGYLVASPTGYYGPATRQAVSRFQADRGIPISGYVDWQTRQSIEQVTCTHYSPQSNGSYSYQDHYTCDGYGPCDHSYAPSYPDGCTSYYDRSCYVNGRYIGPSYDTGTYRGHDDSCYLSNGRWYGDCANQQYGYDYSYPSYYPYDNEYACYYDRACLARMQGRDY